MEKVILFTFSKTKSNGVHADDLLFQLLKKGEKLDILFPIMLGYGNVLVLFYFSFVPIAV